MTQKHPHAQAMALGIKHRADRLKAIGNGQVSAAAAMAWMILEEG